MKKFISIVLIVIILACSLFVIPADATTYDVYLSRFEQESGMTAWCWAACAEMLARNQVSTSRRQRDGVIYVYGSAINEAGNSLDTKKASDYISNNSISTIRGDVPLIESAVKTKISSGYPIIAGISGLSSNDYFHAFVIDQYTDTTSKVRLVDPWIGNTSRYSYNYSDLLIGWSYITGWGNGFWYWYVSIV